MTTDTATPRRTISRRAWIVYCAVCLIFGTTFLAMKIGSNAGMPPFLAAGIRFTAAGVSLVGLRGGIFRRAGRADRPDGAFLRRTALLGFLIIGVTFAATYWAGERISSGLLAQIQTVGPIMVAVFSSVFLRSRLTIYHVSGLAAGFAGSVFLIGAAGGEGASAFAGAAAGFGGSLAYGLGTIWYRHAFGRGPGAVKTDIFRINGFSLLFGGLFLLITAFFTGQTALPFSPAAMGSLVYLIAAGSIIGHSMYLWLIADTSPLFASTWLFISPVIATFAGVLVLGERPTVSNLIGAAAVLAGVYLVQRGERE